RHIFAFDLSFVYDYSIRVDQQQQEKNERKKESQEVVKDEMIPIPKCRMHQSGICGVDVGV
ncbi:hypothetical protein HK102_008343, partial [Quaeritorhiza haematococci]